MSNFDMVDQRHCQHRQCFAIKLRGCLIIKLLQDSKSNVSFKLRICVVNFSWGQLTQNVQSRVKDYIRLNGSIETKQNVFCS